MCAARAYRGRPKSSPTKFAGVARLDYPDGGIAYRVGPRAGRADRRAACRPRTPPRRDVPPASDNPSLVLVPGIPFTALCEHHLLAFTGTATLAYLPVSRIVGLSKLARLTQEYAARPQVQERLGDQIADALMGRLDARGAACILRAAHSCMTLRGARAAGAVTVTSHLRGVFRTDPAARAELIALAGTTV